MISKGFEKVAAGWKPHDLDKAGLKVLMVPAAYTAYKGVKEKNPAEAAMGATEVGGLGILHRAVSKAHA